MARSVSGGVLHRQGHPKILSNRFAESILKTRPLTVGAPTPVRNQGPGRSLPGPDAGQPLHGAGGNGASCRLRPQRVCPLRARSASQRREITVAPGQPYVPAHLRTGRPTRCANRPSKQRVNRLFGRIPRCPQSTVNSQRSPAPTTCGPEAHAGLAPASNAREHVRNT